MKSGHGCLSRNRTRRGSGVSMAATFSLSALAEMPRYRSNENLTAAAINVRRLMKVSARIVRNEPGGKKACVEHDISARPGGDRGANRRPEHERCAEVRTLCR